MILLRFVEQHAALIAAIGTLVTCVGVVIRVLYSMTGGLRSRWAAGTMDRGRKMLAFVATHENFVKYTHSFYRSPAGGVRFYSVRIGNRRVEGTMLSKEPWCGMDIPLDDAVMEGADRRSSASPLIGVGGAAKRRQELLVRRLRETNARLEDKPLYRLDSADNGRISGHVYEGFVNYRFSSGLLYEEICEDLAGVHARNPLKRLSSLLNRHCLRRRLLPRSTDFSNPGSWLCCGGFGALVALKTGRRQRLESLGRDVDEYVFWVQRRSGEVADNQNRLALVPKGFHQPTSGDYLEGFHLRYSVFREMGEELYGVEELEDVDNHLSCDHVINCHEGVAWFFGDDKRLDRGRSTAEILCVGVNAINGNYDFGVLIVIQQPEYYQKFYPEMRKNWESKDMRSIRLWNRSELEGLLGSADEFASENFFHLCEGLLRLRALLGEAVQMPEIHREWS
ncbi:MAG TPA: hypothetical protein P5069_13355 [Candidatus Hydrogenedentes bacterium]|nr:hypothetical protein [Candidatus Hydrogenedentota bacterium]